MKHFKNIITLLASTLLAFSVNAQFQIPDSACDPETLTCSVVVNWNWSQPSERVDGSELGPDEIASYDLSWGNSLVPITGTCGPTVENCVVVDGQTTQEQTAISLPFTRADILIDGMVEFIGQVVLVDTLGLTSDPGQVVVQMLMPPGFIAALTAKPNAVMNLIITVLPE